MAVELNELRDQIDAVDKQMVELLARRLALVEKVGEVKSKHGLPIYVPDREAAMLLLAVKKLSVKAFRRNSLKIFCAARCVSPTPVKKTPALNASTLNCVRW